MSLGGNDDESFASMIKTKDNNLIILGRTNSYGSGVSLNKTTSDYWLGKVEIEDLNANQMVNSRINHVVDIFKENIPEDYIIPIGILVLSVALVVLLVWRKKRK